MDVMVIVDAIHDTQLVVTVLVAIATFATVFTIAVPLLEGDRLGQRMKTMASERARLRAKQREMMDYIYARFRQDPDKHWRWLAHAVIVAKHELKDMPLALKYADALVEQASGDKVPYWAKDMKIIVLEDMGELEAAKILVGGLITSGEITDPYELNFLQNKIRVLEEKLSKSQQDVDK